MKLNRLLPLLALPLLAACAPEIEATLKVSEIAAVAEGGSPVVVPALIRIPQQGSDECKKGLAALIEKLKALAPVTGEGQCISKDQHGSGTQLAEIETAVQLVPAGTDIAEPNLFVIEAAMTDEGHTDLTFKMLRPIGDVISALQAENPMQVSFDPSVFLLRFENDTADKMELLASHVYIDGEPILSENGGGYDLRPNKTVTLQFSDVASSYVEGGNSYYFVTVGPA
jgi:hypothetical protein